MSRRYTIIAENQTLVGAGNITLIGIRPGTTCALKLLRAWVAQRANVTSAQLGIRLYRQPTTFATVVTATPRPLMEGDPASQITGGTALAAGTCGINASAEGGGTKVPLWVDNFNAVSGWLWVPVPGEEIVLSPGSVNAFGMDFIVPPATLTGWTFGVEFEEVG